MEKFIELLVKNLSQNRFIELINDCCTIEPSDDQETQAVKRKKMIALMMLRIQHELDKEAETNEELRDILGAAEKESEADAFVADIKKLMEGGE